MSQDIKPSGLTMSQDIKPSDLTMSQDIKPSGLTMSQDIKPSDLTMSQDIKPSDLTMSQDIKPCDLTMSQDIKPCGLTMSQDIKPCDLTMSQDIKPCGLTMSQDIKPCDLTMSQDIKPSGLTMSQDIKPCDLTMSQDIKPCGLTMSQDIKPRDLTMSQDIKPCGLTMSQDIKPCDLTMSQDIKPSGLTIAASTLQTGFNAHSWIRFESTSNPLRSRPHSFCNVNWISTNCTYTRATLTDAGDSYDTAKKDRYPIIFSWQFSWRCVCATLKKSRLRRERSIWKQQQRRLYFLKKRQVYRRKKYMRAYMRCRLVATRSTLLPRATVATLSHGISYLLADSFVSYYLVELVFHVSIPSSIPNKAFVSAKSQLYMFHERERTSSVNARAHWSCDEGCTH